ncbi:MAG: purine-nucleoside phosphorylase [Lachnospiraceae bacterium]|nr:purine-nucleoside phosphorylase [Lachnospiraceae bacterium]
MNPIYEKLLKCKQSIIDFQKNAGIADFKPKLALVLGSGLGDYAETMKICAELDYAEIDGFPQSTVEGHAGKFVFGYVEDVPVICMKGRVHFYEGYHISDVVLPIRLMGLLGAEILFLTNASGGIGADMKAGTLMLITDHISSFVTNPLTGANVDELGTRFPDMSTVYRPELNDIIRVTAASLNIPLPEGIYGQAAGPSFETPAEVMMFKAMGASAVGMSTAVEAIAANHMGMKVCGVSCVCNPAAGLSETPLTHEEVQEAANEAAPRFKKLVTESIKAFKLT